MKNTRIDLYSEAHLFVAAIRVISHLKKIPPTLEQVCQHISISLEHGGYILRRLEKEAIVEPVRQPHGDRLFVRDHLNIEQFKDREAPSDLDKALSEFKSEKQSLSKKIDSIRADQDKKKKDLFAMLNDQLKASQSQTPQNNGE